MKSNIEKLINEKGYQKQFVAKQVGVSPTQLSHWIKGKHYPAADKLFKLAFVLGCKVDELYSVDLKKGDKLKRIGDGKVFTYSSEADSNEYAYVEEMCAPVRLSDFEKEEL